jgi:hypothetical protein
VIADAGDAVLGPLDFCYLAPREARAVKNRSSTRAFMMEYPAVDVSDPTS